MKNKPNHDHREVTLDQTLEPLIPLFISETRKDLEVAKAALLENDFEKITLIAHTLKGDCGSYGFEVLAKDANALEKFSRKKDTPETQQKIDKMLSDLSRIRVRFR